MLMGERGTGYIINLFLKDTCGNLAEDEQEIVGDCLWGLQGSLFIVHHLFQFSPRYVTSLKKFLMLIFLNLQSYFLWQ